MNPARTSQGRVLTAKGYHANIVIYSGSASRAAHLSLRTPGGQKIAEFLGL